MLLASTGTSYLLLLSARPATTKEPTGSWQCRYGNLSILPLIKTCPRYRNLYFSAGKLYSHSQKLLPTKYLSFEKQFLLSKETTLSLSRFPLSFTTLFLHDPEMGGERKELRDRGNDVSRRSREKKRWKGNKKI